MDNSTNLMKIKIQLVTFHVFLLKLKTFEPALSCGCTYPISILIFNLNMIGVICNCEKWRWNENLLIQNLWKLHKASSSHFWENRSPTFGRWCWRQTQYPAHQIPWCRSLSILYQQTSHRSLWCHEVHFPSQPGVEG